MRRITRVYYRPHGVLPSDVVVAMSAPYRTRSSNIATCCVHTIRQHFTTYLNNVAVATHAHYSTGVIFKLTDTN